MSDTASPLRNAAQLDAELSSSLGASPMVGADELQASLDRSLGAPEPTWTEGFLKKQVGRGFLPQEALFDPLYKAYIDIESDPFQAVAKLNASRYFADTLGMEFGTALSNYDSISSAWYGAARSPIDAWSAITESFEAGRISMELGNLWARKRDGEATPEDLERIKELEDEMPAPDRFRRSLPVEILKAAANSIPYSATSAAAGFGAGAVAQGIASLIFPEGALAIGAIATVARTVGSMAASYGSMSGLEYRDMIKAGMNPEVAAPYSKWSGLLQAAIESDQVMGLLPTAVAKKSLVSAATKVIGDGLLKGNFRAPLMKFMIRQGSRAVSEGTEEALQQIVSESAYEIARLVSNDHGTLVEGKTWDDVSSAIVQNFVQGAMASLPLGVLGEPFQIAQDITDWKSYLASETAKARAKMSEADLMTAAAAEAGAPDSLANPRLAKKADGLVDPAHAYRDVDSRQLYSEIRTIETRTDSGGQERTDAVMKFGNPETNELYGYFRHEVSGDTVTITGVDFDRPAPGEAEAAPDEAAAQAGPVADAADLPASMKSLFKEAFIDLAGKYPGMTIVWDAAGTTEVELRDEIIRDNPRGEAFGLQWFDSSGSVSKVRTLQELRRKLYGDRQALHLEKPGQVDAAVRVVDSLARSIELSGDEFLLAGYSEGVYEKGVAGLARQDVRGGITFANLGDMTKSLLHFSEKADLSTWIHENIHAYVSFLRSNKGRSAAVDKRLSEIETVFDIADGNWDAVSSKWTSQYQTFAEGRGIDLSNHEVVAYAVEEFLRTGKVPNEGAPRTLVEKLGAWLADIYKAIRGLRVQITPEIRELFERILADPESPIARAVARQDEAQSASVEENIDQGPDRATAAQEGPAELSQRPDNQDFIGIDYAAKDIDIVYGSRAKYDNAVNAIQHELFGKDYDEKTLDDEKRTAQEEPHVAGQVRHPRRRDAPVSAALGRADQVAFPELREIRGKLSRIDLSGQRVQSAEEVARLFSVYRHPSIEHFHLIYVDDRGTILAHNALSSGLPAQSIAIERIGSLEDVRRRMERLNATGYYLLHNHPSGNVEPSYPDMMLTGRYASGAPGFLGHVIIDHNRGTIVKKIPSGDALTVDKLNEYTSATTWDQPSRLMERRVTTPQEAFEFARDTLNAEFHTSVLVLDNGNRIIAWHPERKVTSERVHQLVAEDGGVSAIVVTDSDETYNAAIEEESAAGTTGMFANLLDLIKVQGDGFESAATSSRLSPNRLNHADYKSNQFAENRGHRSWLFQPTMDSFIATARDFTSWEEFRDETEATWNWTDEGIHAPEDLSPAEKDAWYKQVWEEAHTPADPEAAAATSNEEILSTFLDELRKPGGLEVYLAELGNTEAAALEYQKVGTEDEAEYVESQRVFELADRLRREVHPLVRNTATGVARSGRSIRSETRAAILTIIEHGLTDYAALAAEIRGSENLRAAAAAELGTREKNFGKLRDPRAEKWTSLTIADRARLARAFEDQETRRKIESGELGLEEVERLLESLDEEHKKIEAEKATLQKEVDSQDWQLSIQEKKLLELRALIKETERELQKTNRQLSSSQAQGERTGRALELERSKRTADNLDARREAAADRAESKDAQAAADERLIMHKQWLRSVIQERQRLASKLEALKREAARYKETARVDRREAVQAAIEKTTLRLRGIEERKRAARELREEKFSLARQIMEEASYKTINWDQVKEIKAIQSMIDPRFRNPEAWRIDWKGRKYSKDEFNRILEESPDVKLILGQKWYERLSKRGLESLSVDELTELRDKVDALRALGREIHAAREAEYKYNVAAERGRLIDTLEASGKFVDPGAYGSQEFKKAVKKKTGLAIGKFFDMDDRHFALFLDNMMENGQFNKLMIEQERECRIREVENVERRTGKVVDFMKAHAISIAKMAQTDVVIDTGISSIGEGGKLTFSKEALLFMRLALRDEDSRKALIGGNFFTPNFRSRENYDDEATLEAFAKRIDRNIKSVVEGNLSEDEKALADLIGEDFSVEFDRFQEAFVVSFNHEMEKVKFYVPIRRQGATYESLEAEVVEEFKTSRGLTTAPAKGMTVKRRTISLRHQKPVRLDLFGIYFDAVKKEEHLIAYADYIKKMNSIVKSNQAEDLRFHLLMTHGREAVDRLDKFISERANPDIFKVYEGTDKAIRFLRGSLGAGYLGFRPASALKQLLTSWEPFLPYTGAHLASTALESIAKTPWKFVQEVEARSAILRSRSMNEWQTILRNRDAEGFQRLLSEIGNKGMKLIEYTDRYCVAIGWKAVYDKAVAEGVDPEAASKKADDVVLLTQPSGASQDLAPFFKSGGEAMKVFTQFMSPLGRIWQNWRYDVPAAFKNGHTAQGVGIILSYMLTGAILYAVLGQKGDDEDKEARKWILSSFSQFTDSVPLIGSYVSELARIGITGSGGGMIRSDPLPAISKAFQGVGTITKGMLEGSVDEMLKGFGTTMEGAGLVVGVPVSAIKDVIRATEEGPGALIGIRKEK